MDIWFKINVTVWVAFAAMMVFDIAFYGKGKSPRPIAALGNLMMAFSILSWPAYWLSLLWA